MVKANNLIVIKGGLIRDAELIDKPGLLQFSIGVDGAGSEKGSDNNSGYFDVKVWLTGSDYAPAATAKNARAAYDNGQLTKGTRVEIIGSIRQERWTDKDNKRSTRTYIIADSVDLIIRKNTGNEAAPAGSVAAAASTSAPLSLDSF